ncbi:hypothetical protein EDC01DRAFT_669863 [Geopyxis carbonaria]|nr:hypothetical protein EDC01DRAFT_669863 [Geopyxis carbonaria]
MISGYIYQEPSSKRAALLRDAHEKNEHKMRKPGSRQNTHNITQLPDRILRRICHYLRCPVVIHKPRNEYLHPFFESQPILEADPRDIFNFYRSCRALYEMRKPVSNKETGFLHKHVITIQRESSIDSPTHHHGIISRSSTKKRPMTVKSREDSVYEVKSPKSKRPLDAVQIKEEEDHAILMSNLHGLCIQWVQNFIEWPLPAADDPQINPTTEVLLNLEKRFVGVLNFHQYSNDNESDTDFSGFGGFSFWTVICLCSPKFFLFMHGAGSSIWDPASPCPRVVFVTSIYSEARETYEYTLASAYRELRSKRTRTDL